MSSVTLERVLAWFDRISAVPRSSGQEKAVSDLVRDFAVERGLAVQQDDWHNLLIRKPAAPGQAGRPGLALQAHLDMVAEKDPGSAHDFAVDPIAVRRQGDFLSADGTALGADDGIGVALLLAILESDDVAHPALEFLFTTREETGLEGAKALDFGPLESDVLLNVDGESEGVFLTSCAGGTTVDLTVDLGPLEQLEGCLRVELSGLAGGHSGLDIDKGRPNGLLAVAELLRGIADAMPLRLADLDAPGKFNAINREAAATFWTDGDPSPIIEVWAGALQQSDPGASVVQADAGSARCTTIERSGAVLDLLSALPQGVHSHSPVLDGVVESSLNVGLARTEGATLVITASTRSADRARHDELLAIVDDATQAAGAEVNRYGAYPAWEFRTDNPLLRQATAIYERRFGKPPVVTGVHGGLECAVLSDKYPDLPMLSVGADLFDCHTPRERASVSSIERLNQLVVAITEEVGHGVGSP